MHGSIADHTSFDPVVDVLRADFETHAMDRRGFGATCDTPGYTIERDFEDVAAVVDAVAARTGGPVALFGHSYGAGCAMGGAARTGNVRHLVLYEPGLGLRYPPGAIDRVEAALAAGDPEVAIVMVLSEILELTDAEIEAMRGTPLWHTRLAAAPTVPRECRVEEEWAYQPGQLDAITAPTLLLAGSESPADLARATELAAAAVPNGRIHVLEGHAHFAHKSDPRTVTGIIRQFTAT